MKTRTFVAASPLWPGFRLPWPRPKDSHERRAQITCAEGSTWDDAVQRCVVISS